MAGRHGGQNRKYTRQLGDKVCRMIGVEMLTVSEISRRLGLARDTIYGWRADWPEFRANFEIAQKMRVEGFIDDITRIADEVVRVGSDKTIEAELRRSMVRSLEIAANQKRLLLEKVNPQKYGARPDIPPVYQPAGQLTEEQRRAEVDRAIDAAFSQPIIEPPKPSPPPTSEKYETVEREFVSDDALSEEEAKAPVRRLPVLYRGPRPTGLWSG
jgi:transposase-like protein